MQFRLLNLVAIWLLVTSLCEHAHGQSPRIQFPASSPPVRTAQLGTTPAPSLTTPPNTGGITPFTPSTTLPPAGTTGVPPGATLGAPTFDPFSTHPNTTPPALFPSTPGYTVPPPSQPFYGQPSTVYPGYPAQPPSQFPGTQFPGGYQRPGLFGGLFNQPQGPLFPSAGPNVKLLDDLRFRYTWIPGDNGRELDINDIELSFTMNWPNFLHSGEPLKVSPGFAFHYWQGPAPPFSPPADLPPRAYSTWLDFNWRSNQQMRFGVEANFVAGYYSDFQKYDDTAVRFQGTGLGWFRITEILTAKLGVTYLDRLDVKLLPAAGLFWNPQEDTRVELYFPRPRFAHRVTTIGNTDVWGYIGGEYGGGSWTVRRTFGGPIPIEQVDINDIRIYIGAEWITGLLGANGFFEIGYVFDRELVYRFNSPNQQTLEDSLMLRGGFSL